MSICNWCKPLVIYLSFKINLCHGCVSSINSHITNGAPQWTETVQKLSILKCKLERESDRKSAPPPHRRARGLCWSGIFCYAESFSPWHPPAADTPCSSLWGKHLSSLHLSEAFCFCPSWQRGTSSAPEQDRESRAWISRCFAFTPMFALVLPNTEGWKSPWYKRLQVPSPYQFCNPLKAGKEE